MNSFFLKDISSVFLLFKRFLKPYITTILILVLLNTCTGFLQALLPLSVAPAVNIILGENPGPANSLSAVTLDNLGPTVLHVFGIEGSDFLMIITVVAFSYLICTCIIALVRSVAYILSASVQGKALHDVIIALHEHILTLPISFYNSKREGDIISRFTTDSTATVNLLDSLIRGLLQSLIQALFLLAMLFRTDPMLALATVGIGGGHFLITRILSGIVRKRTRKVYDFYGRMTTALQESLQNIRVTKCFAAEKFDSARLATEVKSVRDSLLKFRIARYIEEPFRLVADALSVCGMLFLAYYAMESGDLSKSGFGMFVFLASRVVVPISEFSKHFLSIFAVAGSADRLISIFSLRSSLIDGTLRATPLRDKISFAKVSFSHDNGKEILKDLSFEIGKGEMVAVVGPSGAGKSTLCDLLLRLYDPTSGNVYIDGQNIRKLKLETYLSQFGVVPQESLLLNTSIRENVLYGREFVRETYEKSVTMANAKEFIESLIDKDETQIGDRGVRLSGGQKQRLAIARALYGMPGILILDEATSSLDTESERLVQDAIDNVIRKMTALVVAHRLSTVLHADKIIVMRNGRIEEIGSHQELLITSKVYQRLVNMQFRSEQL